MSLIHTVHNKILFILPLLLIITMLTNNNTISHSDESAKGRQMSELRKEVQAENTDLFWLISNAKSDIEKIFEEIEEKQTEVEEALDRLEESMN